MELKERYSRYVGDANARVLAEGDFHVIEGEECEVTVMLADVRSFTSYTENHNPAEVIDILDEYFEPVVETVFEYGGAIDKFMGDCVMAIFGAPASGLTDKYESHAITAVKAALEARRRVRTLSDRRSDQANDILKIGYTLNSGKAVAGHIGSSLRKDYSVLGDMVNECARIEKYVEEDGLFVGQQTYSLVRDEIRARKKQAVKVKGKKQLVHIYEILELI